jgi:hypothetical protein
MGDWKAVKLGTNAQMELYNLKTDPGEKENVADKHPDIVAKIEEYLKTARTDSKDWPIKSASELKTAKPREQDGKPKPESRL